jgi:hypothetical protein
MLPLYDARCVQCDAHGLGLVGLRFFFFFFFFSLGEDKGEDGKLV